MTACQAIPIGLLLMMAGACARPDAELQHRIEENLCAEHVAEDVHVSVSRRVVTLRGVVDSRRERDRIEDVVRSVGTVLAVDDRLVIQQPPSLTAATPEAIETAAVTSALAAAGFTTLSADVVGETIHVRGRVPSARHDDAMRAVRQAAPKAAVVDETTPE